LTVPASFPASPRASPPAPSLLPFLPFPLLLPAPPAAALASGVAPAGAPPLAVFALGGGPFALSLFALGAGVFAVLSPPGAPPLGGAAFAEVILPWLLAAFPPPAGLALRPAPLALPRLKDAAAHTHLDLSGMTSP
ncbi:Hsp70 family protein, partial [Chlamydia psittaci]|uniref:Hsp70 family protein n=1 Tax=Chlamydia psittaci TaxID=83554 RepID=UPI0035C84565